MSRPSPSVGGRDGSRVGTDTETGWLASSEFKLLLFLQHLNAILEHGEMARSSERG